MREREKGKCGLDFWKLFLHGKVNKTSLSKGSGVFPAAGAIQTHPWKNIGVGDCPVSAGDELDVLSTSPLFIMIIYIIRQL